MAESYYFKLLMCRIKLEERVWVKSVRWNALIALRNCVVPATAIGLQEGWEDSPLLLLWFILNLQLRIWFGFYLVATPSKFEFFLRYYYVSIK